jgi:hypothetical protein
MAMDDAYGPLEVVKKMDTLMKLINVESFEPEQSQSSKVNERYKVFGLPLVVLPHSKLWLR